MQLDQCRIIADNQLGQVRIGAIQFSQRLEFSSDKWLHLAAGFIIAFFVGLFGVFYGLCAGIAAAAGKELYDNFSKKGTPEVWDFIFSVVGVLAGVLNVLLARLVFHFIV
nr:MAG TPA: putative periplasmic lipoprotein [Caudoviricetes sp.]